MAVFSFHSALQQERIARDSNGRLNSNRLVRVLA